MNTLYYGDNLDILREHLADKSVDLVYLDPPFNSKRDYNLLFKSPKGQQSEAQITAFEDSWHWGEQAEREFDELLHQANTDVAQLMKALRGFLGENDMMAYLTMMANRLLELHRVLKPTGSLYLHCDPTASHYLKIVLDGVFGKGNMRNEVIWRRTSSHNDPKRFGTIHDTIFYYVKEVGKATWNPQHIEYTEEYMEKYFKYRDPDGRRYWANTLTAPGPRPNLEYPWKGILPPKGRCWSMEKEKLEEMDRQGRIHYSGTGFPLRKYYLDEMKGAPVQDMWTDIDRVGSFGSGNVEKLGYPTQKPLALLKRIILASSNEGDVVLDPFCGCGTATHASEKLKRQWIGIDITHLAISLIEKRLKDAFGNSCKFKVEGTPEDPASAADLAARDKYQFQWWAVSLVEAQPFQGKKKGADGGIDGLKYFYDVRDTDARSIVVSVKGGNLKADDVRALNHVREREKADIAILISLQEPSRGMKADAAAAGFFAAESGKKYPRIQLLTIEGLLSGVQRAEHPDHVKHATFKRAKKETGPKKTGKTLFEADE
jgi:site-specific DNA-methyltransferase (adenine-specific)